MPWRRLIQGIICPPRMAANPNPEVASAPEPRGAGVNFRSLSRLALITLVLTALDLALYIAWRIALFEGHPTGMFAALPLWEGILTVVIAAFGSVLLGRWIRRRFIWRLRNRLILTYAFIGLIPVLLLVSIGAISLSLLARQFAGYVANRNIDREVERVALINTQAASALRT